MDDKEPHGRPDEASRTHKYRRRPGQNKKQYRKAKRGVKSCVKELSKTPAKNPLNSHNYLPAFTGSSRKFKLGKVKKVREDNSKSGSLRKYKIRSNKVENAEARHARKLAEKATRDKANKNVTEIAETRHARKLAEQAARDKVKVTTIDNAKTKRFLRK